MFGEALDFQVIQWDKAPFCQLWSSLRRISQTISQSNTSFPTSSCFQAKPASLPRQRRPFPTLFSNPIKDPQGRSLSYHPVLSKFPSPEPFLRSSLNSKGKSSVCVFSVCLSTDADAHHLLQISRRRTRHQVHPLFGLPFSRRTALSWDSC